MKKLIALAFAAIAVSAFANKTEFPYDVSMTDRITTNDTVTVSGGQVTLTGTVTPASDSVAQLNMSAVTFTAVEADDWDDFVSGLSGVAMLAIKAESNATNWYGYSAGAWVKLTGLAIDLTAKYDVEIAFDKTTGNKIGYSAKVSGSDATMTQLKDSNNNYWLAQGVSATQISAIDLKGTGSADSANLASGARGAYANITGVEQTYSFDYSNVVIDVNVASGAYGDNLKVTLKNGDVTKVVQKQIAEGANSFDFSDQQLVPGTSYDCIIEVVKSDAPAYTNENSGAVTLAATADWFGYNGGASLIKATGTNVTIAEGKISATDEDSPAVITPDSASAANAKSTVEISVDYTEAFAETASYADAQSALALTATGWQCLAGGSWTAITNDNVSAAAGVYATRAEFDYTINPGKVRFSVKSSDTWYVMKNGGTEWFDLSGASNKLNGTSFVGGGKVSAIAATYATTDPIPPTVDGTTITLVGSTDMDLSKVDAGEYTVNSAAGKNYNMRWTDNGKYAKVVNDKLVVTSGDPANGIGSYNSFVLGLDAASATSKPVLDSIQNAQSDKLTLKVPNVTPNTDVADVTMKVVEMDSPSAASGKEYEFSEGAATIDLPDGVKYYKVKISIKTK